MYNYREPCDAPASRHPTQRHLAGYRYSGCAPAGMLGRKCAKISGNKLETFSHTSTDVISANLSTAVTKLSDWLRQRGLILNETKSHLLAVYAGRKQPTPPIKVTCDRTPLPEASSVKYLGVTMDSTLTFKEHIDKVAAKMAQKIGALWRARHCLSEAARARYVTSVVLPDALCLALFQWLTVEC